MPIKSFLRRLAKRVLYANDYTRYDGSTLPTPDQRYCGPQFKDNAYYVRRTSRRSPSILKGISSKNILARCMSCATIRTTSSLWRSKRGSLSKRLPTAPKWMGKAPFILQSSKLCPIQPLFPLLNLFPI